MSRSFPFGSTSRRSTVNPTPERRKSRNRSLRFAVGYAANATAAGISLDRLSIELEGDLDLSTFLGLEPEGHTGFRHIRATVHVESGASPDQLQILHEQVIAT